MLDGVLDSGVESPTQCAKRVTRAWLVRYAEFAAVDHEFVKTPEAEVALRARHAQQQAQDDATPPGAYRSTHRSSIYDMRWQSPRNLILSLGEPTTFGRRNHDVFNMLDCIPEAEFVGNGDISGATINKRAKKGEPILFRGDAYGRDGDLWDTHHFFVLKGITKDVSASAAHRFHKAWAKRVMRSPELVTAWQAKHWEHPAIVIALDEAFEESGMKF